MLRKEIAAPLVINFSLLSPAYTTYCQLMGLIEKFYRFKMLSFTVLDDK